MRISRLWTRVLSFVGYGKYDEKIVYFDLDFTKNRAALEDKLTIKLYGEYMSKNRRRYKENPVAYWGECERYAEYKRRGERFK